MAKQKRRVHKSSGGSPATDFTDRNAIDQKRQVQKSSGGKPAKLGMDAYRSKRAYNRDLDHRPLGALATD